MNNNYINDADMYQFFDEQAEGIFQGLGSGKNEYETANCLTVYGASQIYESLKAVYRREDALEEICLIDNVLGILNKHICIEGMEYLLLNNYAEIENHIFFEHTHNGEPKRIREHYKHQFRNAYLGLLFLDRYKLSESVVDCILRERNEYTGYILCMTGIAEMEHKKNGGKGIGIEDARKTVKDVIYKAFFLSALFHDIGYPLAYYFRMSTQIHGFTPFFKIINPGMKAEFVEIKALLNNSLLFRLTCTEEIESKYKEDDHGCLSALSFLMNFYFSGRIYSISEKERCIVEVAAVAIYKHTNHYDGNKRMHFRDDPVSFLLRMCDDLQEWQRFSIVINDAHNFLRCSDCGGVIKLKEGADSYTCRCGREYKKISRIVNRKANYIDICEGLIIDEREPGKKDGSDRSITVEIDYDVYRQLELILTDYKTARYRQSELEKVETMLRFQKYLPEIRLKYFLSNNPICLISEMVDRSNKSLDEIRLQAENETNRSKAAQEAFITFLNEYEMIKNNEPKKFGEKLEVNAIRYEQEAAEYVREHLGEIYTLNEMLTSS